MPNTAQKRSKLKRSKQEHQRSPKEKPEKSAEINYKVASREPWAPEALTAGKLLLSLRICAAVWSHITDCDEVYNYWEPAHYIIHGYGFQTWEYSPVYALRSYAYILLHTWPVKFLSLVLPDSPKVMHFYLTRCLLGLVCTLYEIYFYKAVRKAYGNHIGRLLLCFLMLGVGPFMASVALLPSSFTMYMTLLAYAAWLNKEYPVAIAAVAAGTLLGWPFFGVLGVPIAIDLVYRKRHVWYFTKYALYSGIVFLVFSLWLDTNLYGKVTVAPWNILLYNVFTSHGPDLYGTEPWTYYFVNGFLNFNVAFLLALMSLPLVILVAALKKTSSRGVPPMWLTLLGLYLWALIFFTRPHKEERFLFPVYPLIGLAAAFSLDSIQKVLDYILCPQKLVKRCHTETTYLLTLAVCLVYSLLSISRGLALHFGYHAPIDVYTHTVEVASNPDIHPLSSDRHVNLCVGKEWYRFPSNFFLPSDKWHLQFIQSEFKGQLPKPYAAGHNATQVIPTDMNDLNKEEPSRYISLTKCHYLVDLDLPQESRLEPRYSAMTANWTIMYSSKFLDAARCPQPFRSFYIPYLTAQKCFYVNYNLLQSTNIRRTR